MPLYNKDGLIIDQWTRDQERAVTDGSGQPVLLQFTEFLQLTEGGSINVRSAGVEVDVNVEPEQLAPFIDRLGLISIRFGSFKDGRGFTLARLLRERCGYTAELRASGDILPDQIHFLLRVGFSTFELPEHFPAHRVCEALERYSVWFQSAADSATPVHVLRQTSRMEAAE